MAQSPSLTLKEIRPHGTKSFPCAIYHTQFTEKGTLVKHHWHEETEILYFYKGDFRLMVNMEQFTIHSECIFIINSGELHSIISENPGSSMEDAVVFHPSMLSFETCDAAQMQVIQPLLNGSLKFPRYLSPEHPGFSSIRQAVLLLENTDLPVMDICLECGFNNLGNFLREFRKYKKTTPLQYRKNLFGTVHSRD